MRKGNREMKKNADFDFDARLGRESAKGYSYFWISLFDSREDDARFTLVRSASFLETIAIVIVIFFLVPRERERERMRIEARNTTRKGIIYILDKCRVRIYRYTIRWDRQPKLMKICYLICEIIRAIGRKSARGNERSQVERKRERKKNIIGQFVYLRLSPRPTASLIRYLAKEIYGAACEFLLEACRGGLGYVCAFRVILRARTFFSLLGHAGVSLLLYTRDINRFLSPSDASEYREKKKRKLLTRLEF